jgi:glutamine amidotransferase
MKSALVIDYGVGNVQSVISFVKNFGFNVKLSIDPDEIIDSNLVVLPGVGSFGPAKNKMDLMGVSEAIVTRSQFEKPILGICLGFQLLTHGSDEAKGVPGLSLIDANTRNLENGPVIGWQDTRYQINDSVLVNSFYYNHSYGVFVKSDADDYSYSRTESCISHFRKDSILGVQFHPEKSQKAGSDFFSSMLRSDWFIKL